MWGFGLEGVVGGKKYGKKRGKETRKLHQGGEAEPEGVKKTEFPRFGRRGNMIEQPSIFDGEGYRRLLVYFWGAT